MDEPRRLPPPYPPLALRQRGNAISVRQKPDQDAGWGTLNRPKRFELPLLQPHSLYTRLGYEAEPSSEVWQFTATAAVTLQVNRISSDRYANSVAVALLDGANRRVAPLVESALGVGQPVRLEPGVYKLVAALGLPEQVTVELQLNAAPANGLVGALRAQLNGLGVLLQQQSQRRLSGAAPISVGGRGCLINAAGHLKANAPLELRATGVLRRPLLQASSSIGLRASGALHPRGVAVLTGKARQQAAATLQIRPVRWLDQPNTFWRARVVGGVLELNRSYLAHGMDPASTALQQQQLNEALNR